MGSDIRTFIVDWQRFINEVEMLAEEDADIYAISDVGGDAPDNEYANARAAFLECSKQFAEYWGTERQENFERVFYTLFWLESPNPQRICDLPRAVDEAIEEIHTALSPTRVKDLSTIAEHISFGNLAAYFQPSHVWFNKYDDFRLYGEFWTNLLFAAAKQNKGVIVCEFH